MVGRRGAAGAGRVGDPTRAEGGSAAVTGACVRLSVYVSARARVCVCVGGACINFFWGGIAPAPSVKTYDQPTNTQKSDAPAAATAG